MPKSLARHIPKSIPTVNVELQDVTSGERTHPSTDSSSDDTLVPHHVSRRQRVSGGKLNARCNRMISRVSDSLAYEKGPVGLGVSSGSSRSALSPPRNYIPVDDAAHSGLGSAFSMMKGDSSRNPPALIYLSSNHSSSFPEDQRTAQPGTTEVIPEWLTSVFSKLDSSNPLSQLAPPPADPLPSDYSYDQHTLYAPEDEIAETLVDINGGTLQSYYPFHKPNEMLDLPVFPESAAIFDSPPSPFSPVNEFGMLVDGVTANPSHGISHYPAANMSISHTPSEYQPMIHRPIPVRLTSSQAWSDGFSSPDHPPTAYVPTLPTTPVAGSRELQFMPSSYTPIVGQLQGCASIPPSRRNHTIQAGVDAYACDDELEFVSGWPPVPKESPLPVALKAHFPQIDGPFKASSTPLTTDLPFSLPPPYVPSEATFFRYSPQRDVYGARLRQLASSEVAEDRRVFEHHRDLSSFTAQDDDKENAVPRLSPFEVHTPTPRHTEAIIPQTGFGGWTEIRNYVAGRQESSLPPSTPPKSQLSDDTIQSWSQTDRQDGLVGRPSLATLLAESLEE